MLYRIGIDCQLLISRSSVLISWGDLSKSGSDRTAQISRCIDKSDSAEPTLRERDYDRIALDRE
jgi:hypothetical protein